MFGCILMLSTLCVPIDVSPSPTQFTSSDTGVAQAYDAVDGGKRRISVVGSHRSEDKLLNRDGRRRLSGNARDLVRNFSVVAWAVRRHLDYVTQFQFHGNTKDKGFNKAIEEMVEYDSRKKRFDAAGRHSLHSGIRLLESHASLDGDGGFLKLSNGTVQGIEGDRVRNPDAAINLDEWEHGIKKNAAGGAAAYAIHRRVNGTYLQYERTVPESSMLWHACYGRFDQFRGIGPITASLNFFRDVFENFDFALAKAKASMLMGIKVKRNAAVEESGGKVTGGTDAEGNEDKSDYNVEWGRGPVVIDMDPGDDMEVMESETPSNQFQSFTELVMMAALKGLDIPYSFYDESHTNFFGSKGAWYHYERSCKTKRDNLAELLDAWTLWRLQLRVLDGTLKLPSRKILSDMDWLWVPRGMPWWDPAKEVRGDIAAVSAGFDNPQRICREKDRGDVYDNIDKTADVVAYAKTKGVKLSYSLEPDPQPAKSNDANEDDTPPKKEKVSK